MTTPLLQTPLKSALFVDFDNIFITLQGVNSAAATTFATNPLTWLRWLEENPNNAVAGLTGQRRKLLLRRCYLNFQSFARYQRALACAAFAMTDCRSLTSNGKQCNDMYMALGLLDALEHSTLFDEFIIMSGDSDFTPILLRLRERNRRITVITIGQAAGPYLASADEVITGEGFIGQALGQPLIRHRREIDRTGPAVDADEQVLAGLAALLYQQVAALNFVPNQDLASIYKHESVFCSQNDWLGYGSLRALTEQLVEREPRLRLTNEATWGVALSTTGPNTGESCDDAGLPPCSGAAASGPTSLAGPTGLNALAHKLPKTIPRLTAAEFAQVFTLLTELQTQPFDLNGFVKQVRDRSKEQGIPIARDKINRIVIGLSHMGKCLGKEAAPQTPLDLARLYLQNVANLCLAAGQPLTTAEQAGLAAWLLAAIPGSP